MSPACLSARKKRREKLWKWNTKTCQAPVLLGTLRGVECETEHGHSSQKMALTSQERRGRWIGHHIKHTVAMGRKVSFAFHEWNKDGMEEQKSDVIEEERENSWKCETNGPLPPSKRHIHGTCIHSNVSESLTSRYVISWLKPHSSFLVMGLHAGMLLGKLLRSSAR